MISWGTLNQHVCSCSGHIAKGQSHFWKFFLTISITTYSLHDFQWNIIQWFHEGPQTCLLIFMSSCQRSRSLWKNYNVCHNFSQPSSISMKHYKVIPGGTLNTSAHFQLIWSKVKVTLYNHYHLQQVPAAFTDINETVQLFPEGPWHLCSFSKVIRSKVRFKSRSLLPKKL